MNEYEDKLNELIKKRKLKKEELLNLLNEYKTKQNEAQINNFFKQGKLTKQELFDLFKDKKAELKKSPFDFIKNFKLNKLIVFKIGIFFVFIISFFMAIVNVYQTQLKSNDNFHALAGSISLVGFNLICFESFLFSILSKMKVCTKIILGVVFLSLFIFLTSLILISITNAQFDRYQSTLFEEKIATDDNLYELNKTLNEEETEYKNELTNRTNKRDELDNLLKTLEVNTREYNNTYWRISLLNKEIKDYQNKLETVRTQIKDLLVSNKITSVRKVSLYDFLNKIFKNKLNTNFLEFFQIIAPSLIYDLISSISLGLIFFMKED